LPRIGHRQRSEIGGASGKSHPACGQPARDGAQCATTWKNRCADKPLRLSKVQRILSCPLNRPSFRVLLSHSSFSFVIRNAASERRVCEDRFTRGCRQPVMHSSGLGSLSGPICGRSRGGAGTRHTR
jgi:hypothetical protein